MSICSEVGAWARTRLLRAPVLAAWLACSAVAAYYAGSPAQFPTAMLVLALALAGLRLADDLADRAHDRMRHPARVLCRTRHVRAFAGLALLLVAAAPVAAGSGFGSPVALGGYAGYLAALAGTFALTQRARRGWPRVLRLQVVLLKYPLLAWLAGGALLPAPLLPALALYAAVTLHEWLPRPRTGPH